MYELIPNFDFVAFFVAGCSFAVGLAVYGAQKIQRRQLMSMKDVLAEELAARKRIEADFNALLRCSRNIGEQLRDMEQFEAAPTPTPPRLPIDDDDVPTRDKVHELVQHGLSVDEVASVCGLTRGEVDFLSRFFIQESLPQVKHI